MAHLLHLNHEWDFATYGAAAIEVVDSFGTWPITFSSGIYRHPAGSADSLTHPSGGLAISNTAHPCFGTALAAALNAVSGNGYVATWDEATNRYTIEADTAFDVTWTSAEQLRMRALLGFSTNLSGTKTYVGDLVPMFSIEPRRQILVGWTEPEAIEDAVNSRITGSADLSTVGPARVPFIASFELPSEADVATLSEFSTRYCWQQWWNDAGRNGRLCYLVDYQPAVGSTMRWAFKLRKTTWSRATHRRESAALRDRWRILFDALIRGRW